MSKCDLHVEFDREDRRFKAGETVSGTVHLTANREMNHKGVMVEVYWKTHGRGNTDKGEVSTYMLYDQPIAAGERFSWPFSFAAPSGPTTYHGHYVNLDHYVNARVDIAWAFDPMKEEEFILLPSPQPVAVEASLANPSAGFRLSGGIGIVAVVVLLVMSLVMFPCSLVFLPIAAGVAFFAIRNTIAERKLGNVELDWGHSHAVPGQSLPLGLKMTPKSSGKLNGVTAKLIGKEVCVSGSGTNRSTHTHKFHEHETTLQGAIEYGVGQPLVLASDVPMPETGAYTFDVGDNQVVWELQVRIDIPMWPDWNQTRTIVVVPALDGQPVVAQAVTQEVSPEAPVIAETPYPGEGTTEDPFASPEPVSSPEPPQAAEPPVSLPPGEDITSLLEQFASADRFSNERDNLLTANQDRVFQVSIDVEDISRSYGYFEDKRLVDGRTVTGKLVGTDLAVSIRVFASRNEQVDSAGEASVFEANGKPTKWDVLYNRLELCEA